MTMKGIHLQIRNVKEGDYAPVIGVINDCWGRNMADILPKLFFQHFQDTSFVVEENDRIAALDSKESIRAWKENGRHGVAQRLGHGQWCEGFATRVQGGEGV